MKPTKALRYARRLINFDSTSHRSNRVISKYLEMKLSKHGFVVEKLEYRDDNDVRKICLVGKKGGGSGGLAYFCHTDVVPANRWFSSEHGPFEPLVANERLYGRGSCDMKGSIACMLTATQRLTWDELKRPLYFVCTADEEIGYGGARCVVAESRFYREMVSCQTQGIVGEPTCLDVVYAHKGNCSIQAVSKGHAAHSATSEGENANLKMIPFLVEMKQIYEETENQTCWHNDQFRPPTLSWNIGINDNTKAINMKPGKSICTVFARTMPDVDIQPLLERTQQAAAQHGLELSITTQAPFYRDQQSTFVKEMLQLAHRPSGKTVCFGSDASVYSEIEDLVLYGPGNIDQAHTSHEWIALEQIALGTEMYSKLIRHFCCS